MSSTNATSSPRLVACTSNQFRHTAKDCHSSQQTCKDHGRESNFFREASFSADGTTVVTHNEDQGLRSFILPLDLLEAPEEGHQLHAHSTWHSPSNIHSYAIYPYFDLQDPSTTVVLSASADVPLSLRNALHFGTIHAKYSLISSTTEAYLSSYSLAFSRDGKRFVAGSKDRLSVFDCAYDGSGPISTHVLVSSKKGKQQYGRRTLTSSGLVSALSISPEGTLALGTTQREIAIFGNEGSGELVTAFSVAAQAGNGVAPRGTGITALRCSPCGTYLVVAERQSDCLQVYDMRNTMRRVVCLTGRPANTTQRLGIDLVHMAQGYEVWAGGTDGCVRMWQNPGAVEGDHAPDMTLRLHEDAVSSSIWHPGGAVLATGSGQRSGSGLEGTASSKHGLSDLEFGGPIFRGSLADPLRTQDNTLKIWSF